MIKKLNGKNLLELMVYLHNRIDESVGWTFDSINNGKIKDMISYPPGVEISDKELKILQDVIGNEEVKSALKKVMINNAMYPLFDLFNFIDGTGNIPDAEYDWIELIECKYEDIEKIEDREDFLHDLFFETFWEWNERSKSND